MAFAVASGNFSSASIWDTGIVPTGSEDAYANSFTIQVNGTQSCGRVRNDATTYLLPGMPIPAMTSNNTPSGTAFASTITVGNEAWRAFDQNTATSWVTQLGILTGHIGYTFSTGRVIKRYLFRIGSGAGGTAGGVNAPRDFTFQGSMDGITWTDGVGANPPPLDTRTGINVGNNGTFISNILPNTISYTHYRLVITAINGSPNAAAIAELEMTEQTGTVNGGVAGGTFNFNTTGVTVNATSLVHATGSLITVTHTTGSVTLNIVNEFEAGAANSSQVINHSGNGDLTITCPLITGNRSNAGTINAHGINKTSSGTITINGNVGPGLGNNCRGLNSSLGNTTIVGVVTGLTQLNVSPNNAIVQAGGNISIVGDVTGNTIGGNFANYIIDHSGGDLTINGNITGGSLNAATILKTGGAITVTGNVTGNVRAAISGTPTSVTVTGDVIGTGNYAITITGTNTTLITGAIIPSSTSGAISSQGLVRVNTSLVNNNTFQAVWSPRITIEPTTTSITFQRIGGGNQIMQTGAVVNATQPAAGDVRSGTTYGISNEFTGTMAVPIPANVSQGVLVDDDKVGTFLMTPASFVAELNTSSVNVAVRLRNSSTVSTTGAQLASFNI